MMKFSVPPGYVRKKAPAKPKLDPFIPLIDGILRDDKSRPKKQQHTSKRIFERLRDEHGFTGGITIVKDYVAGWRQRTQEMFVPLVHPPGHAQADFGEAIGIIGGVECKIHFFAFDLPHSDACFVVGYPAETTEAFCDGHVRAFAFFGGVPKSILYDNTKIAVARILGDGKRQRTRVFTELQCARCLLGRPGGSNAVLVTTSAALALVVGLVTEDEMACIKDIEEFDPQTLPLRSLWTTRDFFARTWDEIAPGHRSRCSGRAQCLLPRRSRQPGAPGWFGDALKSWLSDAWGAQRFYFLRESSIGCR